MRGKSELGFGSCMLKYNIYKENGTGRDTYISFNSGGNTASNAVCQPGNVKMNRSR